MKTDLIRRVPLFATLSEEEFKRIEHIFQVKNYPKNQIIFLEEETCEYMYIVLAGKVKVTKATATGKETILAIHQEGDFFGEMALLDGKTSPATVSAMEDCRIVTVFHADFQHLLMANEKVVRQIIRVLCGRLRQVWSRVQELSHSSADDRIRAGILQLSQKHGVQGAKGLIINLKITHRELAELVGTSRETVTRALARLQRKGIVQLEHRRIILLKPKELLPAN